MTVLWGVLLYAANAGFETCFAANAGFETCFGWDRWDRWDPQHLTSRIQMLRQF